MVPRDWFILMTDVQGSTKAIQEGRYKQVNMMGAAGITCVLNVSSRQELPYVFGGDGATFLIPPELLNKALLELVKLKNLALKDFNLTLRVGAMSLASVALKDKPLSVAKHELSQGNCIAQFKGNALTEAEKLIKQGHPDVMSLPEERATDADVDGLSCRIEPLVSKNGVMLSLICRSQSNNDVAAVSGVIGGIYEILGENIEAANPTGLKNMKWNWIPETFKAEVLFRKGARSFFSQFWASLKEVLIANTFLKFNISAGGFVAEKYKNELVTNTDFKKFDDNLRMVLDCSLTQAEKIKSLLQQQESAGNIYFGTHESKNALLTCMVFSASLNNHIHFIDGANGGYAYAAAELKKKVPVT